MKRILLHGLYALLFAIHTSAAPPGDLASYLEQCPFDMPPVVEPRFPDRDFAITDYGARPDGRTLNTEAFAAAVRACTQAGGGRVVVPPGLWLTGPIQLANHVNLHVQRGALILFTADRTQYPMIKPSATSRRLTTASPIYGYSLENIAITGSGTIDGSGQSWRPVKQEKTTAKQWQALVASGGAVSADGKIWWPSREALAGSDTVKQLNRIRPGPTAEDMLPARDYLRPYMVRLIDCTNVLIEDVSLRNAPKFVLYPNQCRNVTIRRVNIYNDWWAQNGDGIDISACQGVIVYDCHINVGDDAICMKSSLGSRKPGAAAGLKNVVIAGCTVYRGHGGFVIGSNTDGGMQNLFVTHCSFLGTDIGIRVKSGAGSGGLVQNVFIQDIAMAQIRDAAISFNTGYVNRPAGYREDPDARPAPREKLPVFTGFHFSDITCQGAPTALRLIGLPDSPLREMVFNRLTLSADTGCLATNVRDLRFDQVKVIPARGPVYALDNVQNIDIARGFLPPESEVFIDLKGARSRAIVLAETDLPDAPRRLRCAADVPAQAIVRK